MTGLDDLTRRQYLRATASVGALAGFAGCTGDGGGTPTPTETTGREDTGSPTPTEQRWANRKTLEVMHGWGGGDGKRAIQNTIDAFKSEYPEMPTNFRVITGGGNVSLNAVVLRRMANNNPPSSFANWPGKNMLRYEGFLRDMEEEVWERAGLKDAIKDAAQEKCRFNDGVYAAVPIGSHRLNNLFYNTHVIEEAGVDPTTWTTPGKLLDGLATIQERTDAVPMAHAMKGPWTTLQLWVENFIGGEGLEAYNRFIDGNPPMDAIRRSLRKTRTILKNYINEDAATIGFTTANQKVISGKAATIHQGNWAFGMYRSAEDFAYEEDWDWVTYPGTGDMYVFHLDAFLAPEDNKTPAKTAAWERFVGSKTAQVTFNKYKGSIPLRTDVDPSRLPTYLTDVWRDFEGTNELPPTLTHGLAVAPEKLGACRSAIGNNFSGPFDVDGAARALANAVSD